MSAAQQSHDSLDVYLDDPVALIRDHLVLPNGRAYGECWEPWQQAFFRAIFAMQPDGRPVHRLVYDERRRGESKTEDVAAAATADLLIGPVAHRSYGVAGDQDQAALILDSIQGFIARSPILGELQVQKSIVRNTATGSELRIMAADAPTAYGVRPRKVWFDELSLQPDDRLWVAFWSGIGKNPRSQMVATSMAGYDFQSIGWKVREQARTNPRYYFHTREGSTLAPWISAEDVEEQRATLRPSEFARFWDCRWSEGEESFIDVAWWDRNVEPRVMPSKEIEVVLGVDAGLKRDTAAIAAVAWDAEQRCCWLVAHEIFTPRRGETLDLEDTLEAGIRKLAERFNVREIRFDPWQFQRSAQALTKAGLPMVEWPQSVPNLTAMSTNLYELFKSDQIAVYDDPDIRLAIQRAVAVETGRGMKIAKIKASHKIDIVVALAMAAHGAVQVLASRRPIQPAHTFVIAGNERTDSQIAAFRRWFG